MNSISLKKLVQVKLAYKATGEMVLKVTAEESARAGCDGHGDAPKLDSKGERGGASDETSDERKSGD